jgi:hypothetical protein
LGVPAAAEDAMQQTRAKREWQLSPIAGCTFGNGSSNLVPSAPIFSSFQMNAMALCLAEHSWCLLDRFNAISDVVLTAVFEDKTTHKSPHVSVTIVTILGVTATVGSRLVPDIRYSFLN